MKSQLPGESGRLRDLLPPPAVADHGLLRRMGQDSYGEVWLARCTLGFFRAVKMAGLRQFKDRRPFERPTVALPARGRVAGRRGRARCPIPRALRRRPGNGHPRPAWKAGPQLVDLLHRTAGQLKPGRWRRPRLERRESFGGLATSRVPATPGFPHDLGECPAGHRDREPGLRQPTDTIESLPACRHGGMRSFTSQHIPWRHKDDLMNQSLPGCFK
jgi:hypothetical protein